jgi:SAM-dependent methyltransferase
MYDYALGGMNNFAADRTAFQQIAAAFPPAGPAAWANRAFIERATRTLAAAGIAQFVDIGSGMLTGHDIHHITGSRSTVAYVDINPLTVTHTRDQVRRLDNVLAICGDLRDPDRILYHPHLQQLVDFARPVALVLGAVLHHLPDSDHPAAVIRCLTTALAPGSYLVVSHAAPDPYLPRRAGQESARRVYDRTPTPLVLRDADQLATLLGDSVDLLPPGIVSATAWWPDPLGACEPVQPTMLATVARTRSTI